MKLKIHALTLIILGVNILSPQIECVQNKDESRKRARYSPPSTSKPDKVPKTGRTGIMEVNLNGLPIPIDLNLEADNGVESPKENKIYILTNTSEKNSQQFNTFYNIALAGYKKDAATAQISQKNFYDPTQNIKSSNIIFRDNFDRPHLLNAIRNKVFQNLSGNLKNPVPAQFNAENLKPQPSILLGLNYGERIVLPAIDCQLALVTKVGREKYLYITGLSSSSKEQISREGYYNPLVSLSCLPVIKTKPDENKMCYIHGFVFGYNSMR